jgi:hypothetical protein
MDIEYEPGIEVLLNPSIWKPIAQEIARLEQQREVEKRIILGKLNGGKEVLINRY